MKKLMLLGLLVVGMLGLVLAAEPIARLTQGTAVVAAGATTGSKELWLDTGTGTGAKVITADGTVTPGVGILRALTYSVTGSLTNGTITFYPYDAGVKGSAIYSATRVAAAGYGRFNLTNDIYTGRLLVDVSQTTATNVASTWAWSAIVE